MCSYISSSDNRIYAAAETTYGSIPQVGAQNRIPAVTLSVEEKTERPNRRDKTGSRTFAGLPSGLLKQTRYALTTYMSSWTDTGSQPASGPLFEAAMGAPALAFAGGTVAGSDENGLLQFGSAHNLLSGQAVIAGGEIRFVAAVVDSNTVNLNAPFSMTPQIGSALGASLTYTLSRSLPSFSLFDYWSPSSAVQRILSGAAVDEFSVSVNGDFHQFKFSGPARKVVDSLTFADSEGGLSQFPEEPADPAIDYSIVPGHLGQVWLGPTPKRFYTLTDARVQVRNGIDTRNREFGADSICAVIPGSRAVSINFEIFASADIQTNELFQAARQRSPISAMLQLGQQAGQLFGIYLKSVIPETPVFDDGDARLRWKFSDCRAQGTDNDEIVLALG